MIRTRSSRFTGGFTLFELMVTVTVIAVIAMLVAPQFRNDARLHLMAASAILTSDIEYAQVMTISRPSEPMVVVFDEATVCYWIAYDYDPATPISRDDTGEPYLVELGKGRAAATGNVTFTATDMAGGVLAFDAQGAVLDPTTQPYVELNEGTNWIRLTITTSTGSIVETGG